MVTNPYIAKLMIEARYDDLRRAAGGPRPERPQPPANDELHEQTSRAWRPFGGGRLARRRLKPAADPCP